MGGPPLTNRSPAAPSDAASETLPGAVVILSEWNSGPTIRKCVGALLNQEYPRGRFRVAVVDADSRDGTLQTLRSFHDPSLQLSVIPGCSEAEGQRLAAADSSEELVFFTNSDVFVPADWLRRHAAWHQKGFDIVSGSVFQSGDTVNFARNVRTSGVPRQFPTDGAPLGFGNFSIRNEVLRRLGGIRNLPSHQDAEFVGRAFAAGASVVIDPSIEVVHHHPLGSLKNSFRRSFGYAVNHETLDSSELRHQLARERHGVAEWEVGPARVICELSGLEPWLSYRSFSERVPADLRKPGFVEYLYLRLWGYTAGALLGHTLGRLRGTGEERIRNIHGLRAT